MRMKISAVLILFFAVMLLCLGVSCGCGTQTALAHSSQRIPVIMYHQITRDKKSSGKYVIAEAELEKDLAYLKEKGYETVNVGDIIDYVEGKRTLPEKCVMLTFDDGYETGYTILLPLLKKYNMKAVLSVVGEYTEIYTENGDRNDTYSYLDWDEVRELSQTEEIEIQNHSWNMHYCESDKRRGINKIPGESFETYKDALYSDIGKMQTELMKRTGKKPAAMFYPFGECCEDTLKICRSLGFSATFTCEEKVNTLTKYRRESLYNLGRFNRSGKAEREEFFAKILM